MLERVELPALCFSWNALSSSSISPFGAFLGAFKGLAFPPVDQVRIADQAEEVGRHTSSVNASHREYV
jgi:hypothetical protein